MILIDGKKAAAELREELKQEVAELKTKYNKVPGLTVILIGDMAPSQIYVRNKEKSANEVGLKSEVIKYPDTVEEKTVLEKIEELNNDETVSGILGSASTSKTYRQTKSYRNNYSLKRCRWFSSHECGKFIFRL
jgi:methylenetetrahydrofolate dehydrogenase (NADP+)/methenyltetrahydrofolate cyclohydrolase